MASTWPSERGSSRMVRRSGPGVATDGEGPNKPAAAAPLPPMLSQDTRFLLSPMPASMAQGQNQGQGQCKSSISNTVTLYPLESVPSHLLCAICTLPYENPVHFLPCCHVFCLECIQLWIVMNLGDEHLQNELRRAYPAEEERQWIINEMTGNPGFDGQGQHPHLQQQFMVELARMGHSRSRSGTGTSGNNFYDSFNHFSPAQQQLLQQQQVQQRIALLLESREMPKCPMCRTSLHIHGWDRIEELVKVPTPTRLRPFSQSDETATTTLSFSDWMRGSQGQGERPVSGVERRRRHDRFTANRAARGGSRGGNREDAIGEEEDEEIEMEHVRTTRSRINQTSSSGNTMSPFPSSSSSSSFTARYQHRLEERQQDTSDMNDEEEIQSPTTAVIGRRPSEWMRYQQRQHQAHQERQQANRQRAAAAAAAAAAAEDSGDVPHPHAITTSRLNEQQEQIRRLYIEQENQEELLRTLTARAASILEEEEENRRRAASALTPPVSASDSSNQRSSMLSQQDHQGSQHPELQSSFLERPSDRQERAGSENLEAVHDTPRVLTRQSTLQIDTTLTRTSSRQSQTSQNPSTRSRLISHDSESRPEQVINASSLQPSDDEQGPQDSASRHRGSQRAVDDEQPAESNVDNTMISDMQQGTLAWAQRPSSLRLDLGGQDEPLVLSTGDDDDEGDMSASDSVSESTMSSSGSPDIQLSPSNESTLSYGTTSTFSHSVLNQTTTSTPFSQRSSTHPNWEGNSLSLQMPTIETEGSSVGASQRNTLDSLNEVERDDFDEQPWNDHHRDGDDDDEESHTSFHKEQTSLGCGALIGSTLDIEMSRAESKSRAGGLVDDIAEGEPRPSSSSSLGSKDAATRIPRDAGQDTRVEVPTGVASETSAHPVRAPDRDSIGTSSSYGFRFTQSVWTSRSSGASPLVRELDIHCPIVTAEGSVTTIANMQIDADILARARSNSILLSDDDLPSAHDRPSPIDSPIPTPSTARPRQRFPAGFPLLDDEGQPEEEEEEEEVMEMVEEVEEVTEEEEEVAQYELQATFEARPASVTYVEPILSPVESEIDETLAAGSDSAPRSAVSNREVVGLEEAQSESFITPVSSQPAAAPESIQDPLSAAMMDESILFSLPTDVPSSEVVESTVSADQSHTIATPSIGPLRESLNSPPPLPLPLTAAVQPQEATSSASTQGLSTHDISTFERDTLDEESSLHSRPSTAAEMTSTQNQGLLNATIPERAEQPQSRSEYEPAQFRMVVRYQPRLPKAHVMSDLISQIRVECPNKQFGCTETMEMQRTLLHGRDLCQFRRVMCPRARCGLWMRADQILEHILMVEPSSPASSSSTPSASGPASARSVSSNSGRSHKNGLPRSKTKFGAQSSAHQHQRQNSNSHDAPAGSSTALVTSTPNPLIPACPGLTWEREQLAKATGIIGHLTEENSGLRQTIRQLTLQNTKLNKEKDRFQRYANLGLGRD
ncbi:hypothetical protein BGZ95_004186 [Linnemannia exigua]|uniref:RING-type domain-containing protein n=1 Tax=Linnemannia exigua TaxID=604196 RepID=A0AAD4DHN0_9FUNG|nr:hypothetical protein BGZ95_004186 [Linnemannia exigua]